jgi:hypothetical protein
MKIQKGATEIQGQNLGTEESVRAVEAKEKKEEEEERAGDFEHGLALG